jgi:putative endopeptidase
MRNRYFGPILVSAMLLCGGAGNGPCVVFAGDPPRGIDPSNFDRAVKPGDDFNRYANGGWLDRNPIPAEYGRWGSFNELTEKNNRDLLGLLDEARAATAAKGSITQKIGDLYASGMDSLQLEREGLTPLVPLFQRLAAMEEMRDLPVLLAGLHQYGIHPLFQFYVDQDARQSTQMIAQVDQGGLGLPDRDYYTKDDEKSRAIRDEYVAHVQRMLQLVGDAPELAAQRAKTVLEFETRLAKASMTLLQRRDPNLTYNKLTMDRLGLLTPDFSWAKYFGAFGRSNPPVVNVGQPDFLREVNRMITDVPRRDWKVYVRWQIVRECAPFLTAALADEAFHFNGAVLSGAKENQPRWKRVLRAVNGSLGEALGELYVKKFFAGSAKEKAREMVEHLRTAFRERIQTRAWMSQATKEKALAKLNAFAVKIGYPDIRRDYAGLEINRGTYLFNVMRADSFEFRRMVNKIGRPVDRMEWGMTAPTVNAYYNPTMNEIVFPAGILQPPFFDPNADDAVNFGGMGAVIGHEMTHGFDDQGSQFDAEGNLNNWWTDADGKAFKERTGELEKQYSGYAALDTLHVNGALTLGENIADLGGLTIAYAGLQKSLAAKGNPGLIDGLTPDQRFFLAWAQIWRTKYRPEELRRRVLTDVHSPGMFRASGPLVNIDEFYKAFDVKTGEKMFLDKNQRVEIW